ncbi:MAG TPA: acetyl-CoA C-acyltransferase [Leptospiraceae bacterium]|nr:acetyl-CoA C-acyltransferase [Leptospiraceae bacterium]
MKDPAYILEGRRLPVGAFLGSLSRLGPVELGVLAAQAAIEAASVDPGAVSSIICGNVVPSGPESLYLARHVGLKAGLPISASALNVNRLCGSGLEAIAQAAHQIRAGEDLSLACGVESMSQSPYLAAGARTGIRYGDGKLIDLLSSALTDPYIGQAMGRTAETLAQEYGISRQDQDAWALVSQTRAEAAQKSGKLSDEIKSVQVKDGKEMKVFDRDEFVRGTAAGAKLAGLAPAFLENGTVTAGNASGINDGASAVVVCSERYLQSSGKKPLAKILGWASRGCPPEKMGIGPVHAIPAALASAGIQQEQIQLWEINEAFAAQYLAVAKSLKLDPEITNVNGGAIAIGHPLGASGNRILLGLAKELRRRKLKYGCASLCIGGGQGIAMVIESV